MFDALKKSLLSLVGGESHTMRKYLGEAADDWDESKHPRGNENNAGQFVKKGQNRTDFAKVGKLIFTDFDGVLTDDSTSYRRAFNPDVYGHTQKAISNLKKIAKETGAKIVIASNWRKKGDGEGVVIRGKHFKNPLSSLKEELGDLCVGVIPHGPQGGRKADALSEWMSSHPEFKGEFILLDDHDEGYGEAGYGEMLIKTNASVGLSDCDVDTAIAKLNK